MLKFTEEESYFEAEEIEVDNRILEPKEFEANEVVKPEVRRKFLA